MKKLTLLTLMLASGTMVFAQKKAPAKKPATKPAAVKAAPGGFMTTATGLQYKVVTHGTGTRHAQKGDRLEMHIHVYKNDSSLFDSRAMNAGKPVPFQVQEPAFKGDPIEGFMKMVAGDSAVMRLPVDSLIKQNKQMMPGMKAGDMLVYHVVLVSVKSDAEFKTEQQAKAAAQVKIDEDAIVAYLKKNNIKAQRTASGLYYVIHQEGTGETGKPGVTASVNYTGKLLNGKAFDSNTDPEFKHQQPFSLVLGTGSVIKGWEEGLALMKKGTKATLYIPSGLAYGSQDRSPSIPANSVLVFDMEIVDMANQSDIDDKAIQQYIKDHNMKAEKTASGLYYSVSKQGSGEKPANGQKVSVNYTGMTTDGRKFDSNVDSAFHHVSPFEFTLGTGSVIKGWDEGIALLKPGTKATLLIPSGMGYGSRGQGGAIPPNAVLIFDVELVDVKK